MSSKRFVLGISDSHDAGVVIVSEGGIIAALNEERLVRKKMAAGFPVQCLEQIFSIAGVSPEDIALVGVAGKSSIGEAIPLNNDLSDDSGNHRFSQRVAELIDSVPGGGSLFTNSMTLNAYRGILAYRGQARLERIRKQLERLCIHAPIVSYDHHDAHLASAYYSGGKADALVISNDGFGDGLCSKVAVGDPQNFHLSTISTNSFYNSLGVYYNYVTNFCGFNKSHHAGKTTGLAAFGNPDITLPIFEEMIRWHPERGVYLNHGKLFGRCLKDVHVKLAGYSIEDAAAGIQKHCENILTEMVRHYIHRTGRGNVALVGGLHANVKINQRIAELPEVEQLSIFPNMGDGGLCAGAAFLAMNELLPHGFAPSQLGHVYLGSQYTEGEMYSALANAQLIFSKAENISAEIASRLANGKVVARFDGAMEYGPRSLGNRSILYPAINPDVNKWLNQQLKRTEFMPFAPVLRKKDANDYLVGYNSKTAHAAQFMMVTYNVTTQCKAEAPAVVHVDGTARPQVLDREINPGYYDIISEYDRLTGMKVLVNTSFNMHEEPIVCSPADAIRAYLNSNLDALTLGPFLIDKNFDGGC